MCPLDKRRKARKTDVLDKTASSNNLEQKNQELVKIFSHVNVDKTSEKRIISVLRQQKTRVLKKEPQIRAW